MSFATNLRCRECHREYPLEARHVCDFCFGPVEVTYDYDGIRRSVSRQSIAAGPNSLWRYKDFLPCEAESAVDLGAHASLERIIGPLTEKVGEMWREGTLNAAHEHFATVAIREFLWGSIQPYSASSNAPALLVTTPSGQLHELGAIIVGAAAADIGWRTIYLGPSLPPAEISHAAVQNEVRAVALSIIYPEDDPSLPGTPR